MVSFAACEQVIPSLATEILTLFAALFLLLGAVSSNIMLLVLEGAAQAAMKDRENRIKGITVDHIELNLSASSKLMTKLLHLCGKSFICDVDRKPQYLSSDAEWELNRRAPRLSSYIAPPILPLPSLDGDEDDDVSVDSRRDDSFDTKDSFDHEEYQPPPPPMPPPDEGVGGGARFCRQGGRSRTARTVCTTGTFRRVRQLGISRLQHPVGALTLHHRQDLRRRARAASYLHQCRGRQRGA